MCMPKMNRLYIGSQVFTHLQQYFSNDRSDPSFRIRIIRQSLKIVGLIIYLNRILKWRNSIDPIWTGLSPGHLERIAEDGRYFDITCLFKSHEDKTC